MRSAISLFIFLKSLVVIAVIGYAFYELSNPIVLSVTVALCLYALFVGFDKPRAPELSYRDAKEMERLQRGLAKAQAEYDALMTEQRKREFQRAIAVQKEFEEREAKKRKQMVE